jgi:hypothetical protein
MAVTGDESPGLANSAEKSVGCGEEGELAIPTSNCEFRSSCSDVARAIRDALAAIDAGRVEVARERLEALLRRVR